MGDDKYALARMLPRGHRRKKETGLEQTYLGAITQQIHEMESYS